MGNISYVSYQSCLSAVGFADGIGFNFPFVNASDDIVIKCARLSIKVANYLKRDKLAGRTVTLKLKYADFQTVTRSKSFTHGISDAAAIGEIACELLNKTEAGSRPVRLIGVSISNFPDENTPASVSDIEQLELPF